MKMTNWVNMLKGDFSGLKTEKKITTVSEDAIYRLQWSTGQKTNLVNHSDIIKRINEQMNRTGWEWLRVINDDTKQQQIVYEPTSQSGRGFLHLRRLNDDMLNKKSGE